MIEIDPLAQANAQQWLASNSIDKATKDIINDMMLNNIEEFNDAFYKKLAFGTGGLRGVMGVGTNRMNKYTVAMATQGFVNYIKQNKQGQIKTVISFDSRNNSKTFAQITARVMTANGFTVYMFENLRPTPMLSFAVRELGCDGGVMLTASHNPKEYNGYKAYWNDGGQLVAPHDTLVIEQVDKITDFSQVHCADSMDSITILGEDFDQRFLAHIHALSLSQKIVKKHSSLKIAYTPLNGTGITLVPKALAMYGFKNLHTVKQQATPDGNFPTCPYPNPEEKAAMQLGLNLANEINADILLATDPDADRVGVGVKDLSGNFILLNGNQTGTLLTYYILNRWQEEKRFKGNEYTIKTIVTSELIKEVSQSFGVKSYDVLTGFKFIADKILALEGKETYICGGEESYGFSIGDFVRDKDAIGTCCMVAECTAWAAEQGKSLFELLLDIYVKFSFYKEDLKSITIKGKEGAKEIEEMMSAFRYKPPKTLAGLEVVEIRDYETLFACNLKTGAKTKICLPQSNVLQFFLSDGSKISVRPSGTEPKIKFYFGVCHPLKTREEFDSVSQKAEEKIQTIIKELGIKA